MEEGKIKMIVTYFNLRTTECFDDKRVMEYRSKSTHIPYYFEVNESSVNEYAKGKGVVNEEVGKLVNFLICIIRDERESKFLRKT